MAVRYASTRTPAITLPLEIPFALLEGDQMPRWIETTTRVRWGECDLQGHAYYGSYIPWCDLGREALGVALDIDYVKYTLMTAEFSVRFHRPAKYRDELRIRTWATTPTARLDVHYEIYRRLGGQLLAEAKSTHALVGERGLKIVAPEEFHQKFEAFLAGGAPLVTDELGRVKT
jgi:acyl-CoA thioester hydrolase